MYVLKEPPILQTWLRSLPDSESRFFMAVTAVRVLTSSSGGMTRRKPGETGSTTSMFLTTHASLAGSNALLAARLSPGISSLCDAINRPLAAMDCAIADPDITTSTRAVRRPKLWHTDKFRANNQSPTYIYPNSILPRSHTAAR